LAVALISVALFNAGCRRAEKPAFRRIAVIPVENQSGDRSLDWIGLALAEAVVEQVHGTADAHPVLLPTIRYADTSRCTMALRGYYVVSHGRLLLDLTQERISDGKIISRYTVEEDAGKLLPAAVALARWVDPGARPLETGSLEALRALAEVRFSADPAAVQMACLRSIAADADFGPAYVSLARVLLARNDQAGLREVVARAASRGGAIAGLRRAEIAVVTAMASPNHADRLPALLALSRLSPADAEIFGQLAQEQLKARRYDEAASSYRKAIAVDPANGAYWNQLGYAEAHRRRLDAARAALIEYGKLAPLEANPLDSMGDVHYYLGAFAEAAGYYMQAFQKQPSFLSGGTLYKAARARLMAGDISGADELFQRFRQARSQAGDQLIDYTSAQWLYLSGRRSEGARDMTAIAAAPPGRASAPGAELAALAEVQLAAWAAGEGRPDDARQLALRALSGGARSPQVMVTAAMSLALTDASGVSRLPEGELKALAGACRMLLSGDYAEAARQLAPLADKVDPLSQEQVNVLLAWALIETGRAKEAADLLEVYGVPSAGGEPPFGCLAFPRVFQLKSKVLAAQGRHTEAARMNELYRKLSGEPSAR
jgi:tetratricopeptide (TPR) repeat protein